MNLLDRIKGWFNMLFAGKIKEDFNVKFVSSDRMQQYISKCGNIYAGNPPWRDDDDDIKTVNFAKSICSETARLTMIGTKITVEGSSRADWIQTQIDEIYSDLRKWVEYGCAFGMIVLKPNGDNIECVLPNRFKVTDISGDKVTGIVFVDEERSADGKQYYHRLEYHHTDDRNTWTIQNKCYVSGSANYVGDPIDISNTPWHMLAEEEVFTSETGAGLFGILNMPNANNIDIGSFSGLPIYSEALEELEDLDIAYSRFAKENRQSKRTVLIDSDKMILPGRKINADGMASARRALDLPEFVRNVTGNGVDSFYQEINPTLNTDTRITGINALLSQIGWKCGFSNGAFVFNQKTGMVTATQVEADDRRTIQLIKDIRDQLEKCLKDVIYALNGFADLYDLAPVGDYDESYDFGDITYNREEDRARWWNYVLQGKVSFAYYLEKFEGIPKDEAEELEREAVTKQMEIQQAMQPQMFGGEE